MSWEAQLRKEKPDIKETEERLNRFLRSSILAPFIVGDHVPRSSSQECTRGLIDTISNDAILQLVMQYLKNQKYDASLAILEKESGIPYSGLSAEPCRLTAVARLATIVSDNIVSLALDKSPEAAKDLAHYLTKLDPTSSSLFSQELSSWSEFASNQDGLICDNTDPPSLSPSLMPYIQELITHSYVAPTIPCHVSAASFERIVQLMAGCGERDEQFNLMIIRTYPLYLSPMTFLSLLFDRFHIPPLPDVPLSCVKQVIKKIQQSIISILFNLLDHHFTSLDLEAVDLLRVFIDNVLSKYYRESAKKLREKLEEERSGVDPTQDLISMRSDVPTIKLQAEKEETSSGGIRSGHFDSPHFTTLPTSRPPTINDVSEQALAHHLCVRDQMLYKSVQLNELFKQQWTFPNASVVSPNIVKMTKTFNSTCMIVQSSIKSSTLDEKDRELIIPYWIRVGSLLLEAHNFHSLFAVVSGLISAHSEHEAMFARISTHKRKLFESLKTRVSSQSGFKAIRSALDALPASTSAIPYIGIYLTDLVFVDECHEDMVEDETAKAELINLEKCALYNKAFTSVLKFNRAEDYDTRGQGFDVGIEWLMKDLLHSDE
ncbi:Ras-like guanine nucleotide exchange factor like protein [Aduncisulcus paluster]|uniref:Ras-like guanine nucleotide exchange factor like protein n=1 Tax=Aduncisulcus paluster TaxID=2918883 RepID=A0ABQ5KT64_9EUKA|nr:Ras-like guanine nucleotide exchange factor like protein [Aduncisulcus paluster]